MWLQEIISRKWVRYCCAGCVALIALSFDLKYFMSMAPNASISIGRILAGVFLELAAVAYVSVFGTQPADFVVSGKLGFPPWKSRWLSTIVAAVFPTIFFLVLGSQLVYSGTHEAHRPLTGKFGG